LNSTRTAAVAAAAEQSPEGQGAALPALSADTLRLLTVSCAEARALITASAAQRDGREMLWRVMRNVQDWLVAGGGTSATSDYSTAIASAGTDDTGSTGKQQCMHRPSLNDLVSNLRVMRSSHMHSHYSCVASRGAHGA
jgi:hypothetical protein